MRDSKRTDQDLVAQFKQGQDENDPQYKRDRVLLQVLLDIRDILDQGQDKTTEKKK